MDVTVTLPGTSRWKGHVAGRPEPCSAAMWSVEPTRKRGAHNLEHRRDGEDGFVEAGPELIPGDVREEQAPRLADRRGVLPQLRAARCAHIARASTSAPTTRVKCACDGELDGSLRRTRIGGGGDAGNDVSILQFQSPPPPLPPSPTFRTCAILYVGVGVRVTSRMRGTMPRFFFRFDLRSTPHACHQRGKDAPSCAEPIDRAKCELWLFKQK